MTKLLFLCRLVSVATVFAMAMASPSSAEKRVALVVGNSTYQNTQMLSNPVNDAEDIAAALKSVGFDVIIERNLTKRGMEAVIARFARLAQDADTALVFYAGHGMQHRGQNYLMPIDAKLEDEFNLNFELNKIDDVMIGLDRARGVKILILDACRNNPLAERLSRAASTRDFSLSRGLAKIEPTRGMVIAYSTQPNQVALDGAGRNSPFARALVKEIDEPGLEIGALFRRVARSVNAETDGKQLPELSVSLIGDFYLNTRETDLQAWARTRVSSNSRDYREFIRVHPKSVFTSDARQQLNAIEQAERVRSQAERDNAQREQERIAQDKARREEAAKVEAERIQLVRERAEREQRAKVEEERQGLAREQAAREKAAADASANTKTAMIAPPAEPAPPAPSTAGAVLSGGALVQEIKKELRRVGCYSGRIDDRWSTGETKSSVAKFVKHASAGNAIEPTVDFLKAVRGKHERVCPLECSVREVESNGQCVAKTCPAGSVFGRDGSCEKKKERTAARPAETDKAEKEPSPDKAKSPSRGAAVGDPVKESMHVMGPGSLATGHTMTLTARNGRKMTCTGGSITRNIPRTCFWN